MREYNTSRRTLSIEFCQTSHSYPVLCVCVYIPFWKAVIRLYVVRLTHDKVRCSHFVPLLLPLCVLPSPPPVGQIHLSCALCSCDESSPFQHLRVPGRTCTCAAPLSAAVRRGECSAGFRGTPTRWSFCARSRDTTPSSSNPWDWVKTRCVSRGRGGPGPFLTAGRSPLSRKTPRSLPL